jgi:hypothetical protein
MFQKRLLLCCIYIPPSSLESIIDTLTQTIRSIDSNSNIILVGDFNCPGIDWTTFSSSSAPDSELCDLMLDHNFIQLVTSPTHLHGNCLDLVFTNNPECILNLQVDSCTCKYKSDHHLLTFEIPHYSEVQHKTHKHQAHPDYHKANIAALCSTLNTLLLPTQNQLYSNIHFAWSHLKNSITLACKTHIPTRQHHRPQPTAKMVQLQHPSPN